MEGWQDQPQQLVSAAPVGFAHLLILNTEEKTSQIGTSTAP